MILYKKQITFIIKYHFKGCLSIRIQKIQKKITLQKWKKSVDKRKENSYNNHAVAE